MPAGCDGVFETPLYFGKRSFSNCPRGSFSSGCGTGTRMQSRTTCAIRRHHEFLSSFKAEKRNVGEIGLGYCSDTCLRRCLGFDESERLRTPLVPHRCRKLVIARLVAMVESPRFAITLGHARGLRETPDHEILVQNRSPAQSGRSCSSHPLAMRRPTMVMELRIAGSIANSCQVPGKRVVWGVRNAYLSGNFPHFRGLNARL